MRQDKGLDSGEAHLALCQTTKACGMALRSLHPGEAGVSRAPTPLAVCYGSIRTRAMKPTACGGQRRERIGRTAFGVGYPSLRTPFQRQNRRIARASFAVRCRLGGALSSMSPALAAGAW